MRKLFCLLLVCLLTLGGLCCAEEAQSYLFEDFSGEWLLEIVVQDGYHMSMQSFGLEIPLSLGEDGAAALTFAENDVLEMSWRFEDGRAYLSGYSSDGEIEILLDERNLCLIDEIGEMYFIRPETEV